METLIDEQPLDSGAPFEHGTEAPATPAKEAEPSDVEKRLAALENQLKERDRKISELEGAAKYWSNRAGATVATMDAEEDDAPESEPLPSGADSLEELSKKGLRAIEERGFVRRTDVARMIEQEVTAKAAEIVNGQKFDQRLTTEFPDLLKSDSDLFKRAGAQFRRMVELDPSAQRSRVALYASAQLAAKEIEVEQKMSARDEKNDKEDRRRERIESQQQDRRPRSEDPGDLDVSPTAKQIVANLSRFGVTEADYKKHAANAGGRRRA